MTNIENKGNNRKPSKEAKKFEGKLVVNRLPIKPSGIVPNPFKIVAGIKAITS